MDDTLLHLLKKHLAWYPQMQVRDMYKLIYQGTMGPEHLLTTRQEFTQHLVSEFDDLTPNPELACLEPVRVDNSLFRLNLCGYKMLQPKIEHVITWLMETARLVGGSRRDLVTSWASFVRLCTRDQVAAFPIGEVQDFSAWLQKMDYPEVHHSETYRLAYHPAYRLIAAHFIPELGLEINGKN